MGKVLAIDFGTKYIGIAVSDESKTFAFPLDVLQVKSEENTLNTLKNIVSEQNIECIVVGNPVYLDGSESEFMKKAQEFGKNAEKTLKIPVHYFDERLSTEIALKREKPMNKGKKRKQDMHSEAATIILERYLNFVGK